MASLLKYALRLTREYKENIIPHFDHLTRLRDLIDGMIKSEDVQRFNRTNRNDLISACMQINVRTYMPNATIDMRKQPNCIYFRICQYCHLEADVPSPDDRSFGVQILVRRVRHAAGHRPPARRVRPHGGRRQRTARGAASQRGRGVVGVITIY